MMARTSYVPRRTVPRSGCGSGENGSMTSAIRSFSGDGDSLAANRSTNASAANRNCLGLYAGTYLERETLELTACHKQGGVPAPLERLVSSSASSAHAL